MTCVISADLCAEVLPADAGGVRGDRVTLFPVARPTLFYCVWCGPFASAAPLPVLWREFLAEHPRMLDRGCEEQLLHFVGWLLTTRGYTIEGSL